MTATATAKAPSITSLDTTQTSCTHPADPEWTHKFRHRVADHLQDLWPTRADRIRRCGEAAVRVACDAPHLFPERCVARTCPTCARRGATAVGNRTDERIQVHNLVMESEPWDGPGESSRATWGDQHGRGWKLLTLTTPAVNDREARFNPEALRTSVRRAVKAFLPFWRRTAWGRQVRDSGTRKKRARRDTSAVRVLEVAPGGMVHVHSLVYGEYVPQADLAEAWRAALGVAHPVVVDVRAIGADVARGIREALKYATKGEGSGRDQARNAAAVEYAMHNTRRVSILGALQKIQGRSEDAEAEDIRPEDVHDEFEAPCEACGVLGEWRWLAGPPAGTSRSTMGGARWSRLVCHLRRRRNHEVTESRRTDRPRRSGSRYSYDQGRHQRRVP